MRRAISQTALYELSKGAILGANKISRRHIAQPICRAVLAGNTVQQHLRHPGGLVWRHNEIRRAGLDDGTLEQRLCRRRRHQRSDTEATRRLAKHGNPVGIPGEGGNVVLHPLQRGNLITQPQITVGLQRRCDIPEPAKSPGAKPVGWIHHNNPLLLGQTPTLIEQL